MNSKGYQGGKEEASEAYAVVRRGADGAANVGSVLKANWNKPGLMGAYHLQCMGCHKEMGMEKPVSCTDCHKEKTHEPKKQ